MKEEWKTIKGYPYYRVSNKGRVLSLKRKRVLKDRLLTQSNDKDGYKLVRLCMNGKATTKSVHQLVVTSFLDYDPKKSDKVIDHIDNVKSNNTLNNLQVISQRENASKDKKGSSKHTGVCWYKKTSKWRTQINIDGKVKHLGYFDDEKEASAAYLKAYNLIKQ